MLQFLSFQSFKTFIVCATYMVVGPSIILLNKYILQNLHFPYPIFLSALGVLFSGLFSHVLVRLDIVPLKCADSIQGILWYKRVLPVGFASASTLAFGNIVYLV